MPNANPNRARFLLLRISAVLAQFCDRAAPTNRALQKFPRDWQTLFSNNSVCLPKRRLYFAQDDNSDALETTALAA